VAGGSLTGVLIALLNGVETTNAQGQSISLIESILNAVGVHGWESMGGWADLIGLIFFSGLCFLLIRAAREKLQM
jgi:hypothetical protein